MRWPLLASVALCLALAAVPVASAQVPAASFNATVTVASEPVAPGDSTQAHVVLERMCPSPAMALDQQTVDIAIIGMAAATGPGQATFPQQVCAAQPSSSVELAYTITVPRDLENLTALHFALRVQPRAAGPAMPGGEASWSFTVGVDQPATAAASGQGAEPQQEAPAPAAALLALGLVALAIAVRRRA